MWGGMPGAPPPPPGAGIYGPASAIPQPPPMMMQPQQPNIYQPQQPHQQQQQQQQTQQKHDIFVGNLAFTTTEDQLHQAFSEIGRVLKVRMVTDSETGKPRGFAFIEFEDPQAALSAIRNMNDYELNGRRIRVNFSNSSHLEALAGKLGMDLSQSQSRMGMPAPGTSSNKDSSGGGGAAGGKSGDDASGGTQAIADSLKSFSKGEMYDVIAKLKEMADRDPDEARRLLSGHPQLPEAILHLMSKLDMIKTPVNTEGSYEAATAAIVGGVGLGVPPPGVPPPPPPGGAVPATLPPPPTAAAAPAVAAPQDPRARASDPRARPADPRQAAAAAAAPPQDPRAAASDPRQQAAAAAPPPPMPQQPPPMPQQQQPPPGVPPGAGAPPPPPPHGHYGQQPPPPQPQQPPANVANIDPMLVQQVMSLTNEQIAQLPPDKQQSILQLRQQITGGAM